VPELLYFAAIGATAVIALAANLGRLRKSSALAQQAATVHAELVDWAATTDWKIADGSEVRWVEEAERITGLAGFPQDWDLSSERPGSGAEKYSPIRKWVYRTMLARETSFGRVTVIGCWREDSTSYNVFACLSGAPHTSPYTLDVLPTDHPPGSRLAEDGSPPAGCTELHIDAAVDGLLPPARLRLLSGQILLHTAEWLSADIAEDRCKRLIDLCKELPHGPALGPER